MQRTRRIGTGVRCGAVFAAGSLIGIILGGCVQRSGGSGDGAPTPIRDARTLGGLGDRPGEFAAPRAIDADAAVVGAPAAVWVVDKSARIQRIDARTGECLAWFRMPEWERGKPVGLTVAPAGAGIWPERPEAPVLWVADTHYSRVMVYDPPRNEGAAPRLLASWGSFGTEPGQFLYVTDVAVLMDESGSRVERVYVGEYGGNDRINVFDADRNYLFSFGRRGDGDSPEQVEFDRPQSLAIVRVGGERELVIADARNHRIGRFTLDGELIGWIGSPRESGREPGRFRYPWAVTDNGDGSVLVVEYGNNRVQRIDLASGASLGVWGKPGRGTGELAGPWAVTVLDGSAFVVDTGNSRLVRFRAPGGRRGV